MLSGSLDTFGLEEVLRFVSAAEVTGRIDVVRSRVAGTMLLDRGRVVAATRGATPATHPDDVLAACAELFAGSGGAFVLSRVAEPPLPVLDLDLDDFLTETGRRAQAHAAADLLRELAEPRAVGAAPPPTISLDRPPVRVLTREEQRMRLRL